MKALYWLKIHHSEYKDITIDESNLNWMHDKKEAFIQDNVQTYHCKGSQVKKDQMEAFSNVQYMNVNVGKPELNYTTMSTNKQDSRIDSDKSEMMNELTHTARETNHEDKLLMFPPHGNEPVK